MHLALVIVAALAAEPNVSRISIPDAVEQARAERLIDQVYGKKLKAAQMADEKTKLAAEIYRVVVSESEAASKYAGLQLTKRLAVEAGNGNLGLEVVQTLAAAFELPDAKRNVSRGLRQLGYEISVAR